MNNLTLSEQEQQKAKKDRKEMIAKNSIFSERLKEMFDKNDEEYLNELRKSITEASTNQNKQGAIHILSQHFLNKYKIITLQDTDEIYIYKEGVYIPSGDKLIASECQSILEKLTSINIVNELLGHVRRSTFKKREDILKDEPINKVCLENGIFNLDTYQLEDHTPEIIFFNKLKIKYIEKVECPKIKKFLSEIVGTEEDIKILQEFAGYCLYKKYHIHKAIMLVGSGSNGKSTFINLLKKFLGIENCCSVPLHQLEQDKFAVASLFGKLANMFADLPSRALRETSMFKMLLGEDLISAEKKFKNKFFFENYAKMIFSCNQIPKSPDDSDAFFRRWLIIIFPNQFIDNADPKLIEKITTDEELSGFFNFAIEGLKRLLENRKFSTSQSIKEIREEYIRKSDSVSAFEMDCLLIDSESYIPKKDLYNAYAEYCRNKNYPIVSDNTFHRDLKKRVRVDDYRPSMMVEGKLERVQCWKGIKIGNKADNPDNPDLNQYNVNHVNDVKAKSTLNDDGEPVKITYENVR